MHNPEIYQENSTYQKRDALDLLQEHITKMKWKKVGPRVIDIGCGDGGVTNNVLKEVLPGNYEKLVGCDISNNMISFAQETYGDERTSFMVLDIEKALPDHLKSQYDLVFSTYALHWINDQEAAFNNIYDMLAEDGSCILNILGYHPIFSVIKILSTSKKWSSWMPNADIPVSPYHDSKNPEKEINNMMKKIGFQNIESKCKRNKFIFNNAQSARKMIQSVNGFDIPGSMLDDYMDDFMEELRKMGVTVTHDNNYMTTFDYDLITVYANKTEKI